MRVNQNLIDFMFHHRSLLVQPLQTEAQTETYKARTIKNGNWFKREKLPSSSLDETILQHLKFIIHGV